jgi:hypothetical protein
MEDKTLLLINIPNPEYIEYDQKHQPEVLQIIDQPIYLDFLFENLKANNLSISYFEKYSIWVQNDYIFYIIEKKKKFQEVKLRDHRSIIQKVHNKLKNIKLKMIYNYG